MGVGLGIKSNSGMGFKINSVMVFRLWSLVEVFVGLVNIN